MKVKILFVVFQICALLFLQGCANDGLSEIVDIKNAKSSLPGFLIKRTDLYGNWAWHIDVVKQRDTAIENGNGIEVATRGLSGNYQEYLLIIEHGLWCYDKSHPVDLSKDDYQNKGAFDSIDIKESPNVTLAQCRMLGNDLESLLSCRARSNYKKNISSEIEVQSPVNLGKSEVIKILTTLVWATDKRISENQACGG